MNRAVLMTMKNRLELTERAAKLEPKSSSVYGSKTCRLTSELNANVKSQSLRLSEQLALSPCRKLSRQTRIGPSTISISQCVIMGLTVCLLVEFESTDRRLNRGPPFTGLKATFRCRFRPVLAKSSSSGSSNLRRRCIECSIRSFNIAECSSPIPVGIISLTTHEMSAQA